MDKRLKSILLLSFLLMLLFVPMVSAIRCRTSRDCPTGMECRNRVCVRAAAPAVADSWEQFKGVSLSAVSWIFGYQISFTWVMIYLLIFAMLAFAFRDMIQLFSMFSDATSWVLGAGLAGIAALTGLLSKLVTVVFGAVALYGTIVVSVVLILAFTMFLLAHVFFFRMFLRIRSGKEIKEAVKEAGTVAAGWEKIKEFMKRTQ